ncbi:MAG: hypothetical protein IJ833_07165 [Lachnospiraceae bacterium]|nr:hypothetical protein [Lachnospiraceae bacterium]
MKRLKVLMIAAVMIIVIAGCGQSAKIKQIEDEKQKMLDRFPELSEEAGIIGTYNGTHLEYGMDVSVFEEDGWKLDKYTTYQQSNGILYYTNDKYPGAFLHIFEEQKLLPVAGVRGFAMSVVGTEGGTQLPPMQFQGLSWGASGEEITAVYGEPDVIYDERPYGQNHDRYLYIAPQMVYIIELQVYDEEEMTPGLAAITFTCEPGILQ